MLQKLIATLQGQGIKFYITNAIGPVRDALDNSVLHEYMQQNSMFPTIQDAIGSINYGVGTDERMALQSNR